MISEIGRFPGESWAEILCQKESAAIVWTKYVRQISLTCCHFALNGSKWILLMIAGSHQLKSLLVPFNRRFGSKQCLLLNRFDELNLWMKYDWGSHKSRIIASMADNGSILNFEHSNFWFASSKATNRVEHLREMCNRKTRKPQIVVLFDTFELAASYWKDRKHLLWVPAIWSTVEAGRSSELVADPRWQTYCRLIVAS